MAVGSAHAVEITGITKQSLPWAGAGGIALQAVGVQI